MLSKISAVSFICTILFSSLSFGAEVELKGTMLCTIQDVTVRAIEDGKPKVFSGYKDRKEVGDSFDFEYSLVRGFKDGLEEVELKFLMPSLSDSLHSKLEISFLLNSDDYQELKVSDAVIRVSEKMKSLGVAGGGRELIMRRSQFYFGSRFSMRGHSFKRYYKNDWMGSIVTVSNIVGRSLEVNPTSFSCFHTTRDVYSDIFDTLLGFIKKSYNIDRRGNISSMKKDLQ
jgi:hypothetical protein